MTRAEGDSAAWDLIPGVCGIESEDLKFVRNDSRRPQDGLIVPRA